MPGNNSHKRIINRDNKHPPRILKLGVVHEARHVAARARAGEGSRHADDDAIAARELAREVDLVAGGVLDEDVEVRDAVADADGGGARGVEGAAGEGGGGAEGGKAGEGSEGHFGGLGGWWWWCCGMSVVVVLLGVWLGCRESAESWRYGSSSSTTGTR